MSVEYQEHLGTIEDAVYNECDPKMTVIFSLAFGKIFQVEVISASKKIEKKRI